MWVGFDVWYWKEKLKLLYICTYLPSVHSEVDFSIWVTDFLVLSSIKEILWLTVTPYCLQGMWGLEGDNGLGATNLMSKSMYPTMTAVNSVYAHHLTETNSHFPHVYCMSVELWQAQTVWGWCPCDGPIYLCKMDMVSSPSHPPSAYRKGFFSPNSLLNWDADSRYSCELVGWNSRLERTLPSWSQ